MDSSAELEEKKAIPPTNLGVLTPTSLRDMDSTQESRPVKGQMEYKDLLHLVRGRMQDLSAILDQYKGFVVPLSSSLDYEHFGSDYRIEMGGEVHNRRAALAFWTRQRTELGLQSTLLPPLHCLYLGIITNRRRNSHYLCRGDGRRDTFFAAVLVREDQDDATFRPRPIDRTAFEQGTILAVYNPLNLDHCLKRYRHRKGIFSREQGYSEISCMPLIESGGLDLTRRLDAGFDIEFPATAPDGGIQYVPVDGMDNAEYAALSDSVPSLLDELDVYQRLRLECRHEHFGDVPTIPELRAPCDLLEAVGCLHEQDSWQRVIDILRALRNKPEFDKAGGISVELDNGASAGFLLEHLEENPFDYTERRRCGQNITCMGYAGPFSRFGRDLLFLNKLDSGHPTRGTENGVITWEPLDPNRARRYSLEVFEVQNVVATPMPDDQDYFLMKFLHTSGFVILRLKHTYDVNYTSTDSVDAEHSPILQYAGEDNIEQEDSGFPDDYETYAVEYEVDYGLTESQTELASRT